MEQVPRSQKPGVARRTVRRKIHTQQGGDPSALLSFPQHLQLAQSNDAGRDTILALQRTLGNARMQRFLEDGMFAPPADPTSAPEVGTTGGASAVTSSATDVVPKGTPGTTSATLTITGTPKRKYKLAVEVVESKGHNHAGGVRPSGTLSLKTFTMDSSGTKTITYESNIVGGIERVKVTDDTGAAVSCDINVRVPDLQELTAGTGYELVGQTATHADNHFGTPAAITAYQNTATDFAAVSGSITTIVQAVKAARAAATVPPTTTPAPKPKPAKALTDQQIADHLVKADQTEIEKLADSQLDQLIAAVASWGLLGYNDMSLEWGGVFDINATWAPPHQTHRTGQNMDFRLKGLSAVQRLVVEAILTTHGVDIFHEDTKHWHFTVP